MALALRPRGQGFFHDSAVFLPQQLQSQMAVLPQLLMNGTEVRQRACRLCLEDWGGRRERQRFQPRLIPILWQGPSAARRLGAFQVVLTAIAQLRPICW